MAVTHHAARFGEHRAQFRVGQGDGHDDDSADDPGPDGPRAGQLRRAPGAEQPARADHRAQTGKHESPRADIATYRRIACHLPLLVFGMPDTGWIRKISPWWQNLNPGALSHRS